jgi:hypothetical protein
MQLRKRMRSTCDPAQCMTLHHEEQRTQDRLIELKLCSSASYQGTHHFGAEARPLCTPLMQAPESSWDTLQLLFELCLRLGLSLRLHPMQVL